MYDLKSLADYSLTDAAALFNVAFTGYIGGKVELTAPTLAAMIARDNIDLNLSRVLLREGDQPCGIALIARSGWSCRVAGMGITPETQGKGAGRWLMEALQAEARARQERRMVLEAFEQNTPAVALYQKIGFHIVRRLYGYTAAPFAGERADFTPVDLPEIGKRVALADSIDLPWQVSGAAFMRWGSPMLGVQLDTAYAAFSPANGTLVLRGLFVDPANRGQGHGARLIRALAAAYPDHKWIVPQLSPEEFDGFFTRLGFERLPLNQVQMACPLDTP